MKLFRPDAGPSLSTTTTSPASTVCVSVISGGRCEPVSTMRRRSRPCLGLEDAELLNYVVRQA